MIYNYQKWLFNNTEDNEELYGLKVTEWDIKGTLIYTINYNGINENIKFKQFISNYDFTYKDIRLFNSKDIFESKLNFTKIKDFFKDDLKEVLKKSDYYYRKYNPKYFNQINKWYDKISNKDDIYFYDYQNLLKELNNSDLNFDIMCRVWVKDIYKIKMNLEELENIINNYDYFPCTVNIEYWIQPYICHEDKWIKVMEKEIKENKILKIKFNSLGQEFYNDLSNKTINMNDIKMNLKNPNEWENKLWGIWFQDKWKK